MENEARAALLRSFGDHPYDRLAEKQLVLLAELAREKGLDRHISIDLLVDETVPVLRVQDATEVHFIRDYMRAKRSARRTYEKILGAGSVESDPFKDNEGVKPLRGDFYRFCGEGYVVDIGLLAFKERV